MSLVCKDLGISTGKAECRQTRPWLGSRDPVQIFLAPADFTRKCCRSYMTRASHVVVLLVQGNSPGKASVCMTCEPRARP